MPVPKPRKGEKQDDFMQRCMHEVSQNPDRPNKQNVAICLNAWRAAGHSSPPAPKEAASREISSSGATVTCFARTKIGKIDAAKGIIYGVSVITEGEVQGHGMWSDAKTLQTVLESARTYEGGLKVKLDHGSSVGAIVGYLDNFRIDGPQLRADLHLLQTSEHYAYVLELASTISDQVGMSIAFSFDAEESGEFSYPAVRCVEIYSCDLVDSPAANAGGLFSTTTTTTTTKMSETTTDPEISAATTNEPTLDSRLAAVEAALASLSARFADSAALATKFSALEVVVNGFPKVVDEQKADFEKRLTDQAAEFTSQLKDANILASRKLAATGIPHGKTPSAETGNIVDLQAHMLSLKDPRDQLEFYNKNKEKIHAQFGRK